MRAIVILLGSLVLASTAQADIVKSGPDHFTLKHEASTTLSSDAVWNRLIHPSSWWHPDHTYSGKAENLSLDLRPGGLWQEIWPDGAVAHGQILSFQHGKQLRLSAPFGPLQGMGVSAIWTITISDTEDGSKVVFDEVVNGSTESALDKMAPAVDFVKTEAIRRLTAPEDPTADTPE